MGDYDRNVIGACPRCQELKITGSVSATKSC